MKVKVKDGMLKIPLGKGFPLPAGVCICPSLSTMGRLDRCAPRVLEGDPHDPGAVDRVHKLVALEAIMMWKLTMCPVHGPLKLRYLQGHEA